MASRAIVVGAIAATTFLPFVLSVPVGAQCEEAELLASDGQEDDVFGFAVAIEGDLAVVGAADVSPMNDQYFGAGAVYFYRRDGEHWIEEQSVRPTGERTENFGASVAIENGLVIVGYPYGPYPDRTGCVYLYRHNGNQWVEVEELCPPDGDGGDRFGRDVAIDGDLIVIGSPWDNDNGRDSGSVHVYRRDAQSDEWIHEAKLLASNGSRNDQFGSSVDLSGDIIVVGAYFDDALGDRAGSAYVFRYDPVGRQWIEEAVLYAWDWLPLDFFGWNVATNGEQIFINSPHLDPARPEKEGVYVFEYDVLVGDWVPLQKLQSSYNGFDRFGVGMQVRGNVAAFGAWQDSTRGYWAGAAHVYDFDGEQWVERAKFYSSDITREDAFGSAVALDGARVIVGSPAHGDNGPWSGAAYIFAFDQCNARPGGFNIPAGGHATGGVEELLESDDTYVEVEQMPAVTVLAPSIRMRVAGAINTTGVSGLTVLVEAATTPLAEQPRQRLAVFDHETARWEIIDERPATVEDSTVEVTLSDRPERFVHPETGELRLQVEWFAPRRILDDWIGRVDLVRWEVAP